MNPPRENAAVPTQRQAYMLGLIRKRFEKFISRAIASQFGTGPNLKPSDMAFLRLAQERLGAEDPILCYEVAPSRNSLSELAEFHGTDKGSVGGAAAHSGWPPHAYTRIYWALMARFRNEQLNLLEIGIGSVDDERVANMGKNATPGASLRMWRDFFPRAKIFGADIDPLVQFTEHRVRTRVVDVGSPDSIRELLDWLPKPLHIVIEDASHITEHILTLFELGFPHLDEDGLWFIEDVSKLNLIEVIERLRTVAPKAHISYFAADSKSDRSLRAMLVVVRKII